MVISDLIMSALMMLTEHTDVRFSLLKVCLARFYFC
jgi:hypothetical protein